MSFSGWMIEQKLVHPQHGTLLGNKQEATTAAWVELQRLVLREKSPTYILSDRIYVTFMKWQQYRNGGRISACQGWRRMQGWEGCEGNARVLVLVGMFCVLTSCISVSWLWCCPVALQDGAVVGNWVKGTQKVQCHFLQLRVHLKWPQNRKFNIQK